jgi:hypothetical protein
MKIPNQTPPLKMSALIASSSIDIHDSFVACDIINIDSNFGLLNLEFSKTGVTKTPTFILFSVDVTGSMLENGKMEYVKQTFKNIIEFIAKQSAEVYVRVHAFNNKVEVLINNERVTQDNSDRIISSIMSIQPDGSTAIDLALTESSAAMNDYISLNPDHAVFHVFMTDGEPTLGIRDARGLSELVDKKFSAIFIGFGQGHNSMILRKLSDSPINRYEIVDNMEHTGVVYGNIMHEILYRSISNLEIAVENGTIYDWSTNKWVASIIEPSVVGESKKIYHIKTSMPSQLNIRLTGIPNGLSNPELLDTVCVLPDLENMETGEIHSTRSNLSKYMYRQAVQEIMFESRSVSDIYPFKQSVSALFSKLRGFMRENNLLTDRMMIQLCDDLCIMYRTLGTRMGGTFTLARAQSQGRQQSNTVPMSPDGRDNFDFDSPPRLTRMNAQQQINPFPSITPLRNDPDLADADNVFRMDVVVDEEDDNISNYVVGNDPISCFASPSAVNTMRSITGSGTN